MCDIITMQETTKIIETESSVKDLCEAQGCKYNEDGTYITPNGDTRYYKYLYHKRCGIDGIIFTIKLSTQPIA